MTSASTDVSVAIPVAIVAEPIHDRGWWIEESARASTGWPAVIDVALNMMVAAGIIEHLAAEPGGLWDAPSWRRAAVEYHRRPGRLPVEIEPKRIARLRRLMADNVSLDRAWYEIRDHRRISKALQKEICR